MTSPTLFQFSDPVEFLNHRLEYCKKVNPAYSLRAWSKQLGFRNPAFLSQILRGKRKLKPLLGEKIAQSLQLRPTEKKYFALIVLLANAKEGGAREAIYEQLKTMEKRESTQSLSLDLFRMMSDWYHIAILEMTELRDFRSDAGWISRRLDGKISAASIQLAIQRLLRLNLVTAKGPALRRVKSAWLNIGGSIPNEAVRNFHRQMIEKGLESVTSQKWGERDIRGSTLTIQRKDFMEAKKLIERFHADLMQFAREGDGEDTYQMNTQFFRLTRPD